MAPASNESLCVMVLRSMMNVPRKTDSGSAGTLAWEGISRSIARQWCGQSRRSISRRDCFSTPIGRRAMPQKIHHETDHCFLVTRWPKKTPQKRLFSLVAREFKPTDSAEEPNGEASASGGSSIRVPSVLMRTPVPKPRFLVQAGFQNS